MFVQNQNSVGTCSIAVVLSQISTEFVQRVFLYYERATLFYFDTCSLVCGDKCCCGLGM